MATATLMPSTEFLARPDEFDPSGNRIKEELIGGEVARMADPSKRHELTKNNIRDELAFHLRAHRELGLTATSVWELNGDQPLEDPLLPGFSVSFLVLSPAVNRDRQTH